MRRFTRVYGALLSAAFASIVHAQVIEPNGLSVPVAPMASETSLQSYFAGLTPAEPIDPVAAASDEPSTFSPRCDFEAQLVLSQSSAPGGLAWYNVPTDPTAAPTMIYQVLAETTMPGGVVSSSQIRSDPNYAGGSIGFALTKFGGKPIYYSESSRNADCTSCSMPGHWKLMLAYASALEGNTYYLAWEDWEGANDSSWPDDGDFNDKVFRLSGVRCAGGGEPCSTGKPGVCVQGLTACRVGSEPAACTQLEQPNPEVCDGLDNDCNGMVDDNMPCGVGAVCLRGVCTQACSGSEFPCPDGLTCDKGECVTSECIGVICDAGKSCQLGHCVAPCEAVTCPLGQVCGAGVCKDPCAAISCKGGSVCRQGVCLESCQCGSCSSGLVCDNSTGSCVDSGCAGKQCAAGTACLKGTCVDACQNAQCPRGAACSNGQCADTQSAQRPDPIDASVGTLIPARSLGADASVSETMPTAARSSHAAANGCACGVAGTSLSASAWASALLVGLLAVLRLRRRWRLY